jgi:hypothetical protein
MMPRATLIAARPRKCCGRAACIPLGARSNTWHAKASAALARGGASVPVRVWAARSSDTSISTSWIGRVYRRTAFEHGEIASGGSIYWSAALPMPPTIITSNGRAGGGSGVSKFRITSSLPSRTCASY